MRRRLYRPQVRWIVPTIILVLGFAPIFVLGFSDIEREISTFPDALGPGLIAWTPRDGIGVLIAGVIPFVLAYVASKVKVRLENPAPALIVCFALAPLPFVGTTLFYRGAGEAILEDRIVVREPGPWGRLHEKPLATATQIEKGCGYGGRGRNPSGVYNIVFADGQRVILGTSDASTYGLDRRQYLGMVHRVDSLPSLNSVTRVVREAPWGGAVNDPGCLQELADKYPVEDRATVLRVYSPQAAF